MKATRPDDAGRARSFVRGPRGMIAAAVAALSLLALAGCGGIPTSGPVVPGGALSEADPEYVVSPNSPEQGDSPQEILDGFMLAVRAPTADFHTARQFLTADLSASWKPEAEVSIRVGDEKIAEAPGSTADAPALAYGFDSDASVDDAGRYREQTVSSRTLDFSFARVDGEWRISAAPDGIVLTEVAFQRAFAAAPLYFFDQSERYLVPDVRWFAARPTTTPTAEVGALLKGPDSWLTPALLTEFPTGTALGPGGVVVSGGRATVDLTVQAASASSEALGRMQQQLVATLGVSDVALTASGIPLGPVAGEAAPAKDPQPSCAVLAGTTKDFGCATSGGIADIDGISDVLVADGATTATLAHDQKSVVYLAGDGSVHLLAANSAQSAVIDSRPGLLAPTLDPFGDIWSATGGAKGRIEVFDRSGKDLGVDVADLPANARIAGIALSRDGTRLAVLLSSGTGSRLLVFGVARQDGIPTQLRSPLELLAPAGRPVSIAWTDEATLVVVTAPSRGSHQVQLIPIGSPSTDLGTIGSDGIVVGGIGGGIGGAAGVRALSGGQVLSSGGSGWSSTGIKAVFLGVQQ